MCTKFHEVNRCNLIIHRPNLNISSVFGNEENAFKNSWVFKRFLIKTIQEKCFMVFTCVTYGRRKEMV